MSVGGAHAVHLGLHGVRDGNGRGPHCTATEMVLGGQLILKLFAIAIAEGGEFFIRCLDYEGSFHEMTWYWYKTMSSASSCPLLPLPFHHGVMRQTGPHLELAPQSLLPNLQTLRKLISAYYKLLRIRYFATVE